MAIALPTRIPASLIYGSGKDKLVLTLAQDYYLGDAQYQVFVDGKQVGGTFTASALNSRGQADTLTLLGNWGAGQHAVSVKYINDYADAGGDRNLIVNSIAFNGEVIANSAKRISYNSVFTATSAIAPNRGAIDYGTGTDTLVLKVNEDAFQGNAQYQVLVDGKDVGATFAVSADRKSGATDTVTLHGNWGAGPHDITIKYLNDLYVAGVGDRNMDIVSASYNGKAIAGVATHFNANGAVTFNSSPNLVVGTKGNDVVRGSIGADMMTGVGGNELFIHAKGEGNDIVTDFTVKGAGADVLQLDGYSYTNWVLGAGGIANYSQLQSRFSQVGSDTVITLGSNDAITLKNVLMSDLTASNFNLTSTVAGPSQCYTANGWYTLPNPWGSASLTYGTDYQISGTYNPLAQTTGTTFTWSYPPPTVSWSQVKAFAEVSFGANPYGDTVNAGDAAHVFPLKLSSLDSLKSAYDVTIGGATKGFNVAYDLYTTTVPHGGASTVANEVMIWLHQGDLAAYGTLVGTYSNGDFSAKIYHQGTYTAVIADQDHNSGTIDIADIFHKLESLGIVSSNEYLASASFGAEVVTGAGSLTINSLNYTVQSHDSAGIVTTDVAAGGVTSVTKKGTAGADIFAADTTQLTTLTGGAGNDTFVFNKGMTGQTTITDFHAYTTATAEHDLLKLAGYGTNATITHGAGDVWDIHYAGGVDHITLAGVGNLTAHDFMFI